MILIYVSEIKSPIGLLRIIGTETELLEILFEEAELSKSLDFWTSHFGEIQLHNAPSEGVVKKAQEELDEYFQGKRKKFDIPVKLVGTPFQLKVWQALREIPYGKTYSYQQIAKMVGNPRAVRAVGNANGQNRIPIIVPCHRVINASGQLGGYGGGLSRKVYLLKLETSHA